jgi:KDO2-lipid IV(A) lauroyltransferase
MSVFFARLWVGLVLRSARWSPRARARFAAVLGAVSRALAIPRRRIARANLAACFPQLPQARRLEIERALFRNMARGILDHGVLWSAPRDEIRRFVRVAGHEHLQACAGAPLLLLSPHFVGLDAGASWITTELSAVSIYARQSNPVWDHWLSFGRTRFHPPVLIPRRGADLRAAVRAMREGLPFFYLPDMDIGEANSIFVPFFGVDAATLPMVSRLAKMTGARVCMAVTEQVAEGYVFHIEPPWRDFPGPSVEEDTARMNREIERWVLRMPDQYLWTHRRFKTRPPGEPPFYR